MSFDLRDYQLRLVSDLSKSMASGNRRMIGQLATGGGKTVTFATIGKRFIEKSKKKVLVLVHREELLNQTIKTLRDWYKVNAVPIQAGCKKAPIASCYVAMCETANRRLIKNPGFFGEIGLLITDEAHLGNHFKVYEHFPDSYIIGFTATPLSSKKDKPLKNYFDDIVCGIDIKDLIEQKSLCQNITYSIKGNFDRTTAKTRGGEFAEDEMAAEFKKFKSVKNTLSGYERFCIGKKTVVFNVNVSHSEMVNQAFIDAGYNSRHLDATCGHEYRKECLEWLNKTPDAILNNVGILTTGFDEPSVECIIMNKSTLSMPLWLQCVGRGSRPHETKECFTIVDMGGNAMSHGDWSDERDWHNIFHNPPRKGEGVAPVKECPECERILKISQMQCECGFVFEKEIIEQKYDSIPAEFEIVTKGIDVKEIIEKNKHKKLYYPFYNLGHRLAIEFRSAFVGKKMNDQAAEDLLVFYNDKAKEWCHEHGKKYNQWHKEQAKENLYTHLQKFYPSWQPQIQNN